MWDRSPSCTGLGNEVYKPIESILSHIERPVRIEKIIRPIYSFKASVHPGRRQKEKITRPYLSDSIRCSPYPTNGAVQALPDL
jgi:hypothetical protein